MRIKGLVLMAALVMVCAEATTADKLTKFTPGELWPDDRGVHINAHGGGIVYSEGTYYWFGEHKGEGTSAALVGINCYASQDLLNWEYRGVALSVTDEAGSDLERGCVMERPKVVYNERTKKYVMWFHLELKGQGYAAARYGVAISEQPEGPYTYIGSGRVNPGKIALDIDQAAMDSLVESDYREWWTPEWRVAVEKGLYFKRDMEGGQMSRDQTIFVDDDGTAYHIYSSEENLTIQIAELSEDYTSHTGRFVRVAPGGHNEAPAIFKRNGVYWMITSGCTGWDPNEARLWRAESIWGPWQQLPNPCRGEGANLTFGGQSTYVLKVSGRDDTYIFMADIWRPRNPIDARYIWLPIRFSDDVPLIEWQDEWTLE